MEWLAESCWTLSNASKGAAVTERDGVGSVAVVASSYSHSHQANRASTNSTNRRDPTTKTSHSSAYSSSSGAKQHSSGSFQPLLRTTKPCNFSGQLKSVQVDCNMFRVQVKFKSSSSQFPPFYGTDCALHSSQTSFFQFQVQRWGQRQERLLHHFQFIISMCEGTIVVGSSWSIALCSLSLA